MIPNVEDRVSTFPAYVGTDTDYLVNYADNTFPEKYGRLSIRRTDNDRDQVALYFGTTGSIYYRMMVRGTVTTDWVKLPSRAEVDALDERVTALENS